MAAFLPIFARLGEATLTGIARKAAGRACKATVLAVKA